MGFMKKTEVKSSKICPNCSKIYSEGDICPKCGTKYFEQEKSEIQILKEEKKQMEIREKERKRAEKEKEKQLKNLEKEKNEIKKLEDKFNINLSGKKWFKCGIEEIKYSTFSNQPRRDYDHAYVIINEDNFEIIKESVWLKTNMGMRKLYFYNITSIDYDARGRFHASSSIIINTKSAEHVQLKFVSKENFDLMNNAFESYIEKIHKPQQNAQIEDNIQTTFNADDLLKYAELYEKGLLTEEEFASIKKKLIGSSSESSVKYCMNCGAEVSPDSKFCTECGTQLY